MSKTNIFAIRDEWAKNDAIRDEGLTTPADIQRFDDIVYGPYKENLLDVYQPNDTTTSLATIISIHGGGWCYGDKELYQHYCMRLAQRGFTVINFTYRLAPENKFPSPIEDTFMVFDWISKNYQKYHIDYNNLFIVGDSAGGQLAAQTCTILTNPEYAKRFNVTIPEGFHLNGAGLNCGHYNIHITRNNLFQYKRSFIGAYLPDFSKETKEKMAIFKFITSDFTPSFVMSSYEDFLYHEALPMYQLLQNKGVDSLYKIYGEKGNKEIGHVFHVNCKLSEAKLCNDEECEFFRNHIK